MAIAYTLICVDIIFFLIFCCLFRNIRLAIAIIKTAAVCVKDNLMMLIVPPALSVWVLLWWAFCLSALVFMYSSGTISKSPSGPYAAVEHDSTSKY